MIRMRDGFEVPVVMTYNKKFYNEKSPWILFTNGADSSKDDLNFDYTKLSIMNRGIVCAYPLIRGTKYFDDNWFLSGVGDRKLTHIMDFTDTAIFIKEK
jgi:oligopeptidase B